MNNNRLCAGLALLLCLIAVPVCVRSGASGGDAVELYNAVIRGDVVTVGNLLAAGAAVNTAEVLRQTPLHLAAARGHKAIIQQLLDAGADANALDGMSECTPLHSAVEMRRDAAELLLLAAGASVNGGADGVGEMLLRREGIAQVLATYGAIPLTSPQCASIFAEQHFGSPELAQREQVRLQRVQFLTEQASLERKRAIESTLNEVKVDSERLQRDLQRLIIKMSEHPDVITWWRKGEIDRLHAVSNMRLPIKALERIVMFDSPQDIRAFQGMLE